VFDATELRRAVARTPWPGRPPSRSGWRRWPATTRGCSATRAAALLRNADEGRPGRVTSIDINPEAGFLVTGRWSSVVDLVIGDSQARIAELTTPVDVFLHDSDHAPARERGEFGTVEQRLAPGALLLTDNVTSTDVLGRYAERTGRRFLAWTERPKRHWFPGDGIGAAW